MSDTNSEAVETDKVNDGLDGEVDSAGSALTSATDASDGGNAANGAQVPQGIQGGDIVDAVDGADRADAGSATLGDGTSVDAESAVRSESVASVAEPVTPVEPLPQVVATTATVAATKVGSTVLAPSKPTKDKTSGKSKNPTGASAGVATPPARVRVRRVRLRLTRVDPLSVLRTSFLFAMAIAIALFVVICILWGIIYVSGALESIQKTLDSVVGNAEGEGSINLTQYLQTWRVLGFSALVSVLNVVLMTLIGTVGAYIYNLAASIYGGVEMTLAEDSH